MLRMSSSHPDRPCVKTHTCAKCRKHNSPARHRTWRVQYDLTLRDAIASRYFYVWRERRSFRTTKTQSGHANGPALTLALGCASGPVACVRLGGRQRRGNRADGEYPLACCRIWPDLKMVRSLWRRDPGVATESGSALAEVDWPIWNRGGECLRASIWTG